MFNPKLTTHSFLQLQKVRLVRPVRAKSNWKGVKHSDLVDGIVAAFQRAEFPVNPQKAQLILTRNNWDMAGMIPVTGSLAIGFVASNECRRSLHFYAGSIYDEVGFVVKRFGGQAKYPSWTYDLNFNLKDVCDEAVVLWKSGVVHIAEYAQELTARKISDSGFRNLICSLGEKSLIPWPSMGKVLYKWTITGGKNGLDALLCIAPHVAGRSLDLFDNLYRLGSLLRGKKVAA